ncbi:hypothetical protein HWV62_11934 [Athelia sp. TMB]|nr:hypothetical protein HWV62_11934 [Athelia sp. TMB]
MASASLKHNISEIQAAKLNLLFYLVKFDNYIYRSTSKSDYLLARYKVMRHFFARGGLLDFIHRWARRSWTPLCIVIPPHFLSVLGIQRTAPAGETLRTTERHGPSVSDEIASGTDNVPFSHIGGGQAYTFSEVDFLDVMVEDYADHLCEDDIYSFYAQVNSATAGALCEAHSNLIPMLIPFEKLVMKLTVGQIITCVKLHGPGMKFANRHIHVDTMREALRGHNCPVCPDLVTLLKPARRTAVKKSLPSVDTTWRKRIRTRPAAQLTKWIGSLLKCSPPSENAEFPPKPCTEAEIAEIATDFCRNQLAHHFEEVGCGVCGQLVNNKYAVQIDDTLDLNLLYPMAGSTRKERTRVSQPVEEITGPITDPDCKHVCIPCRDILSKGRLPMHTLANGLWLGKVPPVLGNLTYAEKILIARVCHSRCVVKVQSGMWKMTANTVTFANPTPAVYDVLPPTLAEVDEVLAFIFIGHAQPSEDDLKKTPLLVRCSAVANVLEWLKLNNEHYADLNISYANLAEYPENGCPFVYDFFKKDDVRDIEALPANDQGEEDGTSDGQCPFVVHGLMESDLSPDSGNKDWKQLKADAVKHLTSGGHVMAVGHDNIAQSTYDNPGLYPQMFPWLFPYGKGGLDQPHHEKIISNATRKRWMLMYHDKRFQKDSFFPLIVLNQEQIKQSSAGSRVMVTKKNFNDISDRLLALDVNVLESMIKKMESGERIDAPSPEESLCFRTMRDIDLVAKHVQGSFTSKRYMRNEI